MGLFKSKEQNEHEQFEKGQALVKDILLDSEEIKGVWWSGLDYYIVTDKRFIYVDKQGIKKESTITSILFNKINFTAVKQVNSNLLLKSLIIGISGKEFEFEFADAEYTKLIQQELMKYL